MEGEQRKAAHCTKTAAKTFHCGDTSSVVLRRTSPPVMNGGSEYSNDSKEERERERRKRSFMDACKKKDGMIFETGGALLSTNVTGSIIR